jgi:hypothetical protein
MANRLDKKRRFGGGLSGSLEAIDAEPSPRTETEEMVSRPLLVLTVSIIDRRGLLISKTFFAA